MTAVYPHQVDYCKATIGGLMFSPQFVNIRAMSKEEPQFLEIAARLIAIRKAESDLSQKDWAVRHGFSTSQYNNWEKGIRRITVDEAQRLCDLYGLSLDFVYRGKLSGVPDNIRNML